MTLKTMQIRLIGRGPLKRQQAYGVVVYGTAPRYVISDQKQRAVPLQLPLTVYTSPAADEGGGGYQISMPSLVKCAHPILFGAVKSGADMIIYSHVYDVVLKVPEISQIISMSSSERRCSKPSKEGNAVNVSRFIAGEDPPVSNYTSGVMGL